MVQLSEASSVADHDPGASVTISGSDWPTDGLVHRPYSRPTTRQPADSPQQRTEDFDTQAVSVIFQNLETDGGSHTADSPLLAAGERWPNAVDDFFLNEENDLFAW